MLILHKEGITRLRDNQPSLMNHYTEENKMNIYLTAKLSFLNKLIQLQHHHFE